MVHTQVSLSYTCQKSGEFNKFSRPTIASLLTLNCNYFMTFNPEKDAQCITEVVGVSKLRRCV